MKILYILTTIVVFFSLSGCSGLTSTRSLPQTKVLDEKLEINKNFLNIPIYFQGFEIDNDAIEIKHYEGLLQAEQFWIASPSDTQKLLLEQSAITMIHTGFIQELRFQGLDVRDGNLTSKFKSKGFRLIRLLA